MYATLADLLARATPEDLAKRAAPARRGLDGALLGEGIRRAAPDGTIGADALAAIGALTDSHDDRLYDAGDVAALPAALARLQSALDEAAAVIDGWIRARYPDPPADAGHLKGYCLDLAVEKLAVGPLDEEQQAAAAKRAVAYLEAVARGRVDLAPPEADPSPVVAIPGAPALFTRESLDA